MVKSLDQTCDNSQGTKLEHGLGLIGDNTDCLEEACPSPFKSLVSTPRLNNAVHAQTKSPFRLLQTPAVNWIADLNFDITTPVCPQNFYPGIPGKDTAATPAQYGSRRVSTPQIGGINNLPITTPWLLNALENVRRESRSEFLDILQLIDSEEYSAAKNLKTGKKDSGHMIINDHRLDSYVPEAKTYAAYASSLETEMQNSNGTYKELAPVIRQRCRRSKPMTGEQRQRRQRKITEIAECGTRKSSRLKRPVKRLQIT